MKKLIALVLTALFVSSVPAQEVKPEYKPKLVIELPHGQIVVQNGQFLCPKDMNRAIVVLENGTMMVGCALIDKDIVTIAWEAGFQSKIHIIQDKSGHTDGPAKEENWTPFNLHPKQNT